MFDFLKKFFSIGKSEDDFCLPHEMDKIVHFLKDNSDNKSVFETWQNLNYILQNGSQDKADKKVEVAVIGDFSAGKSSFINAFLGKDICPVESFPTTSSITKFIFAEDEKIFDVTNKKILTKSQYKELITHKYDKQNTTKYNIEYYCPLSYLKEASIYDTPGFLNSSGSGDTNVTLECAKNADLLLFIIDIDIGAISNENIKIIKEIKEHNEDVPIYAILNKADKKSPSARAKIKDEILVNHDFLDECYVYTCIPDEDAQKLVESTKTAVFNNIIKLHNQKQSKPGRQGFELVNTLVKELYDLKSNLKIQNDDYVKLKFDLDIEEELIKELERGIERL